jgi:hypothetical protein
MVTESQVVTSRQAKLKAEIEAGQMPVVLNVSATADETEYTMNDLQAIGWMGKRYTHDSTGEVDGWERDYYGPNPIRVRSMGGSELRVLQPGATLD